MSGLQALIEQAYEQAKAGDWDRLQSEWKECPTLARRCSCYQKVGSGWTFLHQAAYFGNAAACTALICFGADAGAVTNSGKTAAQIAEEQGYPALAALLQRAVLERSHCGLPLPIQTYCQAATFGTRLLSNGQLKRNLWRTQAGL